MFSSLAKSVQNVQTRVSWIQHEKCKQLLSIPSNEDNVQQKRPAPST